MLLVARTLAEDLILKPIAKKLLSREAVDRAVKAMRRMQVPPKPDRRLAELRRLVNEGAFSEEERADRLTGVRRIEHSSPGLHIYRLLLRDRRISEECAMDNRITSIVVIVLGALLLLASLTADLTGIGDGRGFGSKQTMGTIAGIVLLAFGFYFYRKIDASITSGTGKSPEDG